MAQITHKEVATAIRAALNVAGVTAYVPNTRVKRGKAKRGTTYPLIRMHPQANSEDIETMGARVFQVFYMSVIAVSTNADEADDISKAIDAALERVTLTIGTNQHGSTIRVGMVYFDEDAEDDKVYTHSGGIYKIGVKPT